MTNGKAKYDIIPDWLESSEQDSGGDALRIAFSSNVECMIVDYFIFMTNNPHINGILTHVIFFQ